MFGFWTGALAEEAAAQVNEAVAEAAAETAETAAKAVEAAPKEYPAWLWGLGGVVLILAVVLIASKVMKKGKFWTVKTMAVGAVCIALSSVLSLIKLWQMPMGGSITPASMLPLLLFAYVYGAGPGITLGMLHGILQFVLDGGAYAYAGVLPNILDYPLGFGMLGLAGLFGQMKNMPVGLGAGMIVGCLGRFFCSFLSGWIFYGQYAPEGWNPIWYSAVYNISYIGVECVVCVVIGVLAGPRLVRELRKLR